MSYNLSVTGIINVTYLKTGNIIIGNEAIIYFIMSYSQSVPGNLLELGMALHQRYRDYHCRAGQSTHYNC